MQTKSLERIYLITILTVSFIATIISFLSEYKYDLMPCKLCLYQRYIYIAIIPTVLLTYFYLKNLRFSIYIILFFSTMNLMVSGYNVLIEYGIIQPLFKCQNIPLDINSMMKSGLDCQINQWSIFGMSLALINLIISFLVFSSGCFLIKRGDNEK